MKNMSVNASDGIVISIIEDGVMYPVIINDEGMKMLDLTIGAIMGKVIVAKNNPFGKVRMDAIIR